MTKLININRLWLVFGFLMLANGLFSVSLSSAEIRKPATPPQQTTVPVASPKPVTPMFPAKPISLADLFVKSIEVKSPLQEGDKIQEFVTIIIANQGTGASAACEVKIICGPVQVKVPATVFMGKMSQGQSVSIPGIQPGATASIEWPGRTMETWRAGAYKITVEADSTKKVLESNEGNNLGQAQFQVSEKTGVVRKEVPVKGGMPLAPPEAKAKPTNETSSGVGKRNITGIDFASAPNTGTGKREIKGVDFTAAPNIGTGKREIVGVDFTAALNIGTGKREISGVDFTAAPNTGTGKREIKDVDFTAAPNIGTGKREIVGVDFTAAPNIGTGKREITGVNFTVKPPVNN
jgi:hypothetical protein